PRALDVFAREGQPPIRVARGHHGRGDAGGEGEHVELADVLADVEDLPDLLAEDLGALQLALIADGGGKLAGEGDRALSEVLLDPAASEAQAESGESEGHPDEDGDAQQDQLDADAEAHGSSGIPEAAAPCRRLTEAARRARRRRCAPKPRIAERRGRC